MNCFRCTVYCTHTLLGLGVYRTHKLWVLIIINGKIGHHAECEVRINYSFFSNSTHQIDLVKLNYNFKKCSNIMFQYCGWICKTFSVYAIFNYNFKVIITRNSIVNLREDVNVAYHIECTVQQNFTTALSVSNFCLIKCL